MTLLLLLFNLIVTSAYDYTYLRLGRVITIIIFFIMFLFYDGYNIKRLFYAFLLLVISEFGILFYEHNIMWNVKFICTMSAYALIISYLYPKVKNIKLNITSAILFIVLIASNILMLMTVKTYAGIHINGMINELVFYSCGITLLTMVWLTVAYSFRSDSIRSSIILGAVLGFFISDVLVAIAYYLKLFYVYYAERIIAILALMLLLIFSVLEIKKEANKVITN